MIPTRRRLLLVALALWAPAVRAQRRELLISVRRDPPEDTARSADTPSNAYVVRTRPWTETIRAVEGEAATLHLNAPIALSFRRYAVGGRGVDEVGGTVRFEALTRFAVRATVSADVVTLDIAPDEEFVFGASARLAQTVQGRLGEWIAIGGAAAPAGRGVWLRVQLGAAR